MIVRFPCQILLLACLSILSLALTAPPAAATEPQRTVVVGVDATGWPHSFYDESEQRYAGFTIDLLEHVAKKRNWKLEIQGNKEVGGWIDLVEGRVDIALPFAKATTGVQIVETPWGIGWGSLFVPRRVTDSSLFHVQGYRVAVLKHDYFGNRFKELSEKLDLDLSFVHTESLHDAFELVKNGKADAAAVEQIAGRFEAESYDLRSTSMNFGYTSGHFGLSLDRNDNLGQELSSELAALRADPNSIYYQRLDHWYGELIETPLPTWLRTFILVAAIIGCSLMLFGAAMLYQLQQKQLEIERRKQSEAALEYQAYHDELTDLPNRRQLIADIDREIPLASRAAECFHVIFMDLDNFKRVVDSKGHSFGDVVLKAVGQRLLERLGDNCSVARFGGDEFVVLVPSGDARDSSALGDLVSDAFSDAFVVDSEQVFLTASCGISCYPEHGTDSAELLRTADTALYHGKSHGKATVTRYHPLIHRKLATDITEEALLRRALNVELCGAHYQPLVSLEDGRPIAAEALFRCFHPGLANTSVSQLIRIGEETGLITEIGRTMLLSACKQLKDWQRQGIDLEYISVNLSLEQIYRTDVESLVRDVLAEVDIAPSSLVLEVTEAVFMKNPDQVMSVLNALRDLGVQLALDDFGTGYSSLAYMKSLPFSKLKLDRSFVRGLPEDHYDAQLTQAIVSLGSVFGMSIIAEGVETQDQAKFLRDINCPIAQGYLFGKPVSAEEFQQTHFTAAKRTAPATR